MSDAISPPKYIFYPQSTAKTTLAIIDLINDIYIYDRDPKSQKEDKRKSRIVPLNISSSEKMIGMFKSGSGKDRVSLSLPVISCELTSIDPDENRTVQPINRIFSSDNTQFIFTPLPYNFTYEIGIYAKYMSDLLNIFETIVTMFKFTFNYPIIDFKFNDGSYINRNIPITLSSTSLNTTITEIDVNSDRILQTAITLLCKGWIYRPIKGVLVDTTTIGQTGGLKDVDGNYLTASDICILNDVYYSGFPIRNIDITYEEMITQYIDQRIIYN
jgi:hypothetical protein